MKKFDSFFICKPRYGNQPYFVLATNGKSIYKYYAYSRSWSRQSKFDIAFLLDMVLPHSHYTICVDSFSLEYLKTLLLDECELSNVNPYVL